MKSSREAAWLALAAVALVSGPTPAASQTGRLKDGVRERVEEVVERPRRRPPAVPATPANPGTGTTATPAVPGAPGGTVTAGATGGPAAAGTATATAASDFVPGTRPLFVDDFGGDRLGEFPARLQLVRGNLAVVEREGRRFLQAPSEFELRVPLPEVLPQAFTLEFDMIGNGTTYYDGVVKVDFGEGETADHVVCSPFETGIYGRGGFDRKSMGDLKPKGLGGQVIRCRVMADGASAKVYVNDTRAANHPGTQLGRRSHITLSTGRASEENPILIGDIRVMAFEQRTQPATSAPGRVRKLYIFDGTNSDSTKHNALWHLYQRWTGEARWFIAGPDLSGVTTTHKYVAGLAEVCEDKRRGVTDAYLAGYSRGAMTALRVANDARRTCGVNVRFVALVDAVNTSLPVVEWPVWLEPGVPTAVHLRKPRSWDHVLTTADIAGVQTMKAPGNPGHLGMVCKEGDNDSTWRWTIDRLIEYGQRAGGAFSAATYPRTDC